MFPFLIGTVRTKQPVSKLFIYRYVSIPHRYGKNSDDLAMEDIRE